MTVVTQISLSVVMFVLGVFLGILFLLWLLNRKTQNLQEQFDLTDRKQVERMLEIGGQKPSKEKVNRFLASIKENEKKKVGRSKRSTNKEE